MQLFGLALKIIKLIMNIWTDSNNVRKDKKRKLLKEVTDGVKNNDPSAITAALDVANQL